MIKELSGRIKVNRNIKSVPRANRITPELKMWSIYYVCFANNNVYPCRISEIIKEFDQTEVRIKISTKPKYSKYRSGSQVIYNPFEEYLVYANEIGITPEDAVKNMV